MTSTFASSGISRNQVPQALPMMDPARSRELVDAWNSQLPDPSQFLAEDGETSYQYDGSGRLTRIEAIGQEGDLVATRGAGGWALSKVTYDSDWSPRSEVIGRGHSRAEVEQAIGTMTRSSMAPHRPDQSRFRNLTWSYAPAGRLLSVGTNDGTYFGIYCHMSGSCDRPSGQRRAQS